MIGKLKGMIDSYGEDFVILDVQRRRLSGALLGAHPAGAAARPARRSSSRSRPMCARTRSACSALRPATEREWFRLLQTVQGVGTKVALAILSTLKPADLATAIAMRDKATITRTPGVGPKVAERIVTELKDKAPALAAVDPAVVRLSGALDERRAPQPCAMPSRRWSISAMASRRRRRRSRRRCARPARAPTRRG